MDKLKDIRDTLANKLTGKDKYHHNLLGESLQDLLRKATAKTLIAPDELVNQQVVETIQQEVASGKDTKDIVIQLKKRLRTDNPRKQLLGVLLFNKVLTDCSNVLGMHQEEMLQEVAKVMARPAKPESDEGKSARSAAKELLRRYGRAGTTAFRAAHQEVYGRPVHGGQYPGGVPPYGGAYANFAPPPAGFPAQDGTVVDAGALSVEKQSLTDEVTMLIDKARSNTELLSDMLVNSGQQGSDEFENELIADLQAEVIELRGLFTAYLEQLQVMDGPEMEVLMVQALEAADMLDGCIALQQDMRAPQDALGGATDAGAVGTSGGGATTSAPPPKPVSLIDDLIAFDDVTESMAQTTISPTTTADPFAASTTVSGGGAAPEQAAAAAAGGAQPGGKPLGKSAFESMFAANAGGAQAYNALSAAATTLAASAPGVDQQQLAQQPQQPAQQQQQQQGQAPQGYSPYGAAPQYGMPQQQPYGMPPQQHYGAQQPYGASPMPQQYGAPPQQQYGQQQQPFGAPPAAQQYGGSMQYGMPGGQQQYGSFGAPPAYAASGPSYGAPPPPSGPSYGAPPAGAPPAFSGPSYGAPSPQLSVNNPFAANPVTSPQPSDGFGMPMPPAGLMGPNRSANPFAAAPAPAGARMGAGAAGGKPGVGGMSSVDQEWNMFFADRTAGAAPPNTAGAPAQQRQQVNADFDALVAKPAAAR